MQSLHGVDSTIHTRNSGKFHPDTQKRVVAFTSESADPPGTVSNAITY